ncbi:hypothetical protein MNV84_02263 [Leishmania braziliensis]|nr:hypothetical protein MNV84_02263 [Leishmania braziliensis]
MGCANQKSHAQQIAYQREFLGACWNSALSDDEAKEYLASRWMGISRPVMALHTNNHCFTVRALGKEKKTPAPTAVDPSKTPVAAPGNPTGARPDLGGGLGIENGGLCSFASASAAGSSSTHVPLIYPDRVPYSNTCSPVTAHPEPTPASTGNSVPAKTSTTSCPGAGSPRTTMRQGHTSSHGCPHPANSDPESAMANALITAAVTGKTKNAESRTLRTVMKDAIELERIAHSHHPYLQRHELSVYGGVVFRCAPAHRLYHRISFVPEPRAKRLGNAPLSPGADSRQDQQQQSALSTPLVTPSGMAATDRDRSRMRGLGSSLRRRTGGVKRSPIRRSDSERADDGSTLRLGSSMARHTISSGGDWATVDPLSPSNNYPIEDRDIDGVAATRPPVVIGSITAMELQALPPSAELCFGGWLYVSLQDEQKRLRRSLARYEARRQQRAARRKAAAAPSPILSSTWKTLSTSCRDNRSQRQPQGGRLHNCINGENVEGASGHDEYPLLSASVAAHSTSAPQRPQQPCDSSDELTTCSQRPAEVAPPSPLNAALVDSQASLPMDASRKPSVIEDSSDASIAETEGAPHAATTTVDTSPAAEAANPHVDGEKEPQLAQGTPQLSRAQSEERATPSMETTTAPPKPHASFSRVSALDLSASMKSTDASSEHSPIRKLSEPRKCTTSSFPQQTEPLLRSSPSLLATLRRTGKYAQEAMEADALAASWLPYAYVIIAVPMYECSLVPTAFHTAFTRRKAVSLNLANAQSRQAYGVGCITAARYGGVMVVEYREKISENEDAEWIDELLRVGCASQKEYGKAGAKPDDTDTTNPPGFSGSAAARASAPSLQHFSSTMVHHSRAEKLRHIKARIWDKLRHQGLYVVLAETRVANRRHRQQRASVTNGLNMTIQASASCLGTPALGDEDEEEGGVGFDYCAREASAVDYDSLNDNRGTGSDSSSSHADLALRSSGRHRRSLWLQLSRGSGNGSRRHRRRQRRRGNRRSDYDDAVLEGLRPTHFGSSDQRRGVGGRGLTTTLVDSCRWTGQNYDDDDFLLRGTYRQIGGMKYLDVVSLIDGCPVSELVQGIKRWVMNLLSMPIKARPLSLYLQRYEGIASSLQLLSTQLASAALAASVASGHLIAPANLSFHAGGVTGQEEAAASFVSQQQQQQAEATGGRVSTCSFSLASVTLMSASAAAIATQVLPHGVSYNTYYKGPLDPIVRAVLSPELELMIAACQTRQLPDIFRTPQSTAAHMVTSAGATNAGLSSLNSSASVARRGIRDSHRRNSGISSPMPQFLPSVSSSDPGCVASGEAGARAVAQVQGSPPLPTGLSPTMPCAKYPFCVDVKNHPSTSASNDLLPAPLLPSAMLPAVLSLKHKSVEDSSEAAERFPYDNSSQNGSMVGNSCTAVNGRALAAAVAAATAAAGLGDGIDNTNGNGITNASFASPLNTPLSSFRVSKSGTVDIDALAVPSLVQSGKQQEMPLLRSSCPSDAAAKGGTAGSGTRADDVAEAEKPPHVRDSDSNASADPRSTPDDANHPRQRPLRERPAAREAAVTECHDNSGENSANDENHSGTVVPQRVDRAAALVGAEEEKVPHREQEWQVADRELRVLKSELYELHYLVSIARSELLERLEESIQLGAIFLPHTRPDQVALSLLTLKMMRQYPEEVPVKEIHTDWVPMLMSLLTISRDNLFCCADGLTHSTSGTWDFLKTYNNAVAQSDVCDVNQRRKLYDSGTTKYTIDPLPPLPAPRPLHDIVIAPQPVRFTKEALHEIKRVGMDESGLSFTFSGGSFGVLAGVLYYYADFLRAKYRSEVATASGRPKEAGATVQDVLARGGFNVFLRRIWVWGMMPDSSEYKFLISTATTQAKKLLRRKLSRRDNADFASSAEPKSARFADGVDYVVTNTAGLDSGSTRMRGKPFCSAEAYALYDAIVHYLGTLEELHTEHQGNASIAAQGLVRRRSTLMTWRRNKGGPDASFVANENSGEMCSLTGSAAASLAAELVPSFEICVATNYYYKEMMEEARRPRPRARRISSLHRTQSKTAGGKRSTVASLSPPAASSGAASGITSAAVGDRKAEASIPPPRPVGSAGNRAKASKDEVLGKAQQQQLEMPYCGGEEKTRKKSPQRQAVKTIFRFLTNHYEQWRAKHSDDPVVSALAKRVHVSIK